ncbi:MAG: hypothetical protein WAW96_00670 [Alphaproteobacteria bacterium]
MAKKTLSVLGYYGAAVMPVLGLAVLMPWLPRSWLDSPAVSIACILAGLWALLLAGRAWHVTDEAAREAHKSAFFWGGSFGALFGLVALILWTNFSMDGKTRALDMMALWHGAWPHQPLNLILLGALGILVVQIAGYAIAWAGWWLRKPREHNA